MLNAPVTPARTEKKSRFTDDEPEVVVRTFPQTTSNQPEATPQANVKAIFFDADSAVVSKQYDNTLQRIAEILEASPEANAIIEGHTDNSGEEPYNLELSTRRAQAIKDVLAEEYNISTSRLNTVGAGSTHPSNRIRPVADEPITGGSKFGSCMQEARARLSLKRFR